MKTLNELGIGDKIYIWYREHKRIEIGEIIKIEYYFNGDCISWDFVPMFNIDSSKMIFTKYANVSTYFDYAVIISTEFDSLLKYIKENENL